MEKGRRKEGGGKKRKEEKEEEIELEEGQRNLAAPTMKALLHTSACFLLLAPAYSFQLSTLASRGKLANHPFQRRTQLDENKADVETMSSVDEYRNGVTQFLSNFMQKDQEAQMDPLADIDFNSPKVSKMSLEKLAAALDRELYEKEWFVTGRVNPIYFDDGFQFQDPDVKLTGIEGMCIAFYSCFVFALHSFLTGHLYNSKTMQEG